MAAGTVAGAGPLSTFSTLASAGDETDTAATDTETMGTDSTSTETTGTESTDASPTETASTTTTESAPPSGPPTLVSDKDDYLPGATVTLTGENWAPGELVHILVNDDEGQTWSRNVDVLAGADRTIRDQFQLPTTFVAKYTATATGPISGTATTTFTDGNVEAGNASDTPATLMATLRLEAFSGTNPNPNTTCAGNPDPNRVKQYTKTGPGITPGNQVASGSSESTRVTLVSVSGASAFVFSHWKLQDGSPRNENAAVFHTSATSFCYPTAANTNAAFWAVFKLANQAPTVGQISGEATVNEGDTESYSVSATDPDGDTITYSWSITAGNAAIVGSSTGSSVNVHFTDGPSNVTLQVVVGDGQAGHDQTRMLSITENNVAPTATLGNSGPINEGSSATVSFSGQSDPSSADTSAGFHYAFACDNGSLAGATYAGSGTSASTTCGPFPDGPSSQTVRARIIDKDGGFSEYQTAIVVNNVAPTATFNAPASVNEGSPINLSLTSPSDPSSTDTTAGFEYAFDCGSGYGAFGSSNTTSCATTDNGSRTVRGKIRDKDGGVNEYTASVTINNVAPTATLGNNGPINEGSSATITFSNQVDPSSADTAAGFHYAYRCDGNASLLPTTYAGAGTSATHSCSFDDNGSYQVRGRIFDKDDGFNTYVTTVVVNNVAPTADLGNNGPINEGSSATITFSNQVDPSSADTAAGFHYAYRCDGNASLLPTTYAGAGTSATHSCSFDDNGSYQVRGRIFDKDDGFNTYVTTVVVNNVAPVLTAITAPPYGSLYQVNSPVNVTATFTDVGTADTHTCHIDWDDGAGFSTAGSSVTESNGSGTCNATHTYTSAGVYTIRVKVRDDDGAFSNVLEVLVVVYDPSAGFVTGGGWINSPSGAYTPSNPSDADITGRANFGFVSKYKKGATAPEGQTEFQFQMANLNFHSESYQWLVVSGPKAQYKGTGTVNGQSGYTFLLTATDGQVSGGGGADKFRIKIWNSTAVLYDNVPTASEDIDQANPQLIAGGSIVVHK